MLGWHWILDAWECDVARLGERTAIREALTGLPDRLGLTRVGEPQLFEHLDPETGEPTLAGIVLIAESHFSLHARPGHAALHADLFSCKPFDQDAALADLRERFGFKGFEQQRLTRGRGSSE